MSPGGCHATGVTECLARVRHAVGAQCCAEGVSWVQGPQPSPTFSSCQCYTSSERGFRQLIHSPLPGALLRTPSSGPSCAVPQIQLSDGIAWKRKFQGRVMFNKGLSKRGRTSQPSRTLTWLGWMSGTGRVRPALWVEPGPLRILVTLTSGASLRSLKGLSLPRAGGLSRSWAVTVQPVGASGLFSRGISTCTSPVPTLWLPGVGWPCTSAPASSSPAVPLPSTNVM